MARSRNKTKIKVKGRRHRPIRTALSPIRILIGLVLLFAGTGIALGFLALGVAIIVLTAGVGLPVGLSVMAFGGSVAAYAVSLLIPRN